MCVGESGEMREVAYLGLCFSPPVLVCVLELFVFSQLVRS